MRNRACRPAGAPSRSGAEGHARAGNGRDGYRFDQLVGALADARRRRPAPWGAASAAAAGCVAGPTDEERALMATLGIGFDGRGYLFAGFRYANLREALIDARRGNAAA